MFAPTVAAAQGFAGLGTTADGYSLPDPGTRFEYPADHGEHPDFRIEWWYLTANLDGADGESYGVQWTLFRNALSPEGQPEDQAWMAHAAVSGPEGHLHAERFARGGIGQAGVKAAPFEAFIDEWQMSGPSLSDISLFAQGGDWAYELTLKADRPFVPQGAEGFSVKSEEGLASHYYSQPFYQIAGTLILPSGDIEVTGQGWLDREWSSQPLAEDQTGWDWVSLHLDTGDKLMGYRLRREEGTAYTVGTWITPDGTPSPFAPGDITMDARRFADVDGREVPVAWAITVPERGVDILADALFDQSWMPTAVPYWEGPVRVTGSHPGRGYLEMTGYE
ncbi:MAG: lipocalin-like domain-containing protein [Paracoccaceae bacterium]|nr:lipocalin-like domain-containing protein [Paracoccaceae bacterium]